MPVEIVYIDNLDPSLFECATCRGVRLDVYEPVEGTPQRVLEFAGGHQQTYPSHELKIYLPRNFKYKAWSASRTEKV